MSDIQRSESLATPKVGDLVKFRRHMNSPHGIVVKIVELTKSPHPSQPETSAAYIEWACKYTAAGNYQLCILEVVNEVS